MPSLASFNPYDISSYGGGGKVGEPTIIILTTHHRSLILALVLLPNKARTSKITQISNLATFFKGLQLFGLPQILKAITFSFIIIDLFNHIPEFCFIVILGEGAIYLIMFRFDRRQCIHLGQRPTKKKPHISRVPSHPFHTYTKWNSALSISIKCFEAV